MQVIYDITDWLWANVIGYTLLGVGLYFTIRLKFPQVKHFFRAIRTMKKSVQGDDGGVSGFGTLMAALGGQLGTGSLVGVSSALFIGGPGAIFWMWMTALFGMIVSFSETVLGQAFRVKDKDGNYQGGPAYYIEKGLRNKPLAIIISFLYVLGIGIAIASIQTNSIANAFTGVVNIHPIIPGIIVVILAFLVTIGGMQRLANVSTFIVPLMVVVYFSVVLYIVIINFAYIPTIFGAIFESAFTGKSAVGGVVGWTVAEAFRSGVARGMFSNDAGNGSAAIMHASADVKHPVDQGFLGMIGTFITTIIICTATALAILMTGSLESGQDGILLLQTAFGSVLGSLGSWIVFFAMFLFGFTTLLADMHYGESNLTYIFKEKKKIPILVFRVVLAMILVLASVVKLNVIWAAVDLILGMIVFINVLSLMLLFKYVRYIYQHYFREVERGNENPRWDYDLDITKISLSDVDNPHYKKVTKNSVEI
ncbi:alanine/glycine:cation symporter family protein [Sporosarcina soli]|uniref:Alanine/glycine:cation symporter family protein n=1 Tax=Sporosarcina soli TaxID=334736 RepID=A0ABW0TJV5_9BACL